MIFKFSEVSYSASVNNNPSIDVCQIDRKLPYLICIWQPLESDHRLSFGENRNQWIQTKHKVDKY